MDAELLQLLIREIAGLKAKLDVLNERTKGVQHPFTNVSEREILKQEIENLEKRLSKFLK